MGHGTCPVCVTGERTGCRAGHGLEMGQVHAGSSGGILWVSPLFTESLAYAGVMMGQPEAQGGPSVPKDAQS